MRRSAAATFRKASSRFPLTLYIGAIMLITAAFAASLLAKATAEGVHGWPFGVIGILAVLCAAQLAVAVVNWAATLLVTPHSLPRMDFSTVIPPELRTLVVVPTMLISPQSIEGLIESLEVRFLANRDANLHFALLTDFRDAGRETLPEDAPLLQLVQQRVEELNAKYSEEREDRFFLFHRPRRWNPGEQTWMGYERKRGKLAELNSFLR
jgi:uncharacterized membrane protein (DUF485 family)